MILAGVRCRANVLSSRTSRDDHSRRATRLFAAILDLQSFAHRVVLGFVAEVRPSSASRQQSQNREGLVIACPDTLLRRLTNKMRLSARARRSR
jgi:hypothetical protein